jgi:hypothetical protein
MGKNRHHYVPRLYLRHFSSGIAGEDVINIHTLGGNIFRQNVGLKSQCYRWKFYGDTDELEDLLAKYESTIAPLIRRVISDSSLPPHRSTDRNRLFDFVALQMLRTAGETERMKSQIEQMEGHLDSISLLNNKPMNQNDVRSITHMALSFWPKLTSTIVDLGMTLIINDTPFGFITSDNPVVKYNQFCEDIRAVGVLGTLCTGFQLFLPLSPKHLLFMYDKSVYKLNVRDAAVITVNILADVEQINLLQAINAEGVLLFASWSDRPAIENVTRKALRYREADRTRIVEALDPDRPKQHSLLHFHDIIRSIKLSLSFVKIKRDARRMTVLEKINVYRRTNPLAAETNRKKSEGKGIAKFFPIKRSKYQ